MSAKHGGHHVSRTLAFDRDISSREHDLPRHAGLHDEATEEDRDASPGPPRAQCNRRMLSASLPGAPVAQIARRRRCPTRARTAMPCARNAPPGAAPVKRIAASELFFLDLGASRPRRTPPRARRTVAARKPTIPANPIGVSSFSSSGARQREARTSNQRQASTRSRRTTGTKKPPPGSPASCRFACEQSAR